MFVEIRGEKLVGGGLFAPLPPPPTPILNRFKRDKFRDVNQSIEYMFKFKFKSNSKFNMPRAYDKYPYPESPVLFLYVFRNQLAI